MESKYIPALAKKLKNLRYLNCARLCMNTIRNDTSQSVTILPVFLHYFSQNERSRKSLERLCIYVTPDWFTNMINNKIGDKYAFNFPNLKDVSISFRLWSMPKHRGAFENFNELRMMETILSLFCTRKCVHVRSSRNKQLQLQKQNTYVYIHPHIQFVFYVIFFLIDL